MPQFDLVRSAPPNVVTLVRICGGVVAVSRVAGQLQFRTCPRPEPKPLPRGGARVLRLRLPAHG